MRTRTATILTVSAAALTLAGCSSVGQALGGSKVTPDEFRVVTKAPLVVPPDYALRPPTPGEPRPQELQPESAARQALLGQRAALNRSQGENLLVAKAGADKADPLVRYVVDDEFGDISHKEKSFADRVMFWRKDQPQTQAAGANEATPVDPATAVSATGGKPVVIARERRNTGFKLPGL